MTGIASAARFLVNWKACWIMKERVTACSEDFLEATKSEMQGLSPSLP